MGLHIKKAARLQSLGPPPPPPPPANEPLPFILPDNVTLAEATNKPRQHPQPFLACWVAKPAKATGSPGAALRRAAKGS